MSTSPVRNKSNSPIRNLQDKSPKKLQVILEEQQNQNRMKRISLLSRDPHHSYAMLSSGRRAQLATISNFNSVYETQALKQELAKRDQDLECMSRDMSFASGNHKRLQEQLLVENQALKLEITVISRRNFEEIDGLKDKYISMVAEDSNLVRKNYAEDMRRLLGDLDGSKQLLAEKEREIEHLSALSHRNSQEYSANLQRLIAENNLLRNEIRYCEINKNNEVRQAESRKELEKSRTKGIMSFCKETNAFIEKQMAQLGEQLLEKNISIESFTKELMRQRKHQETQDRQSQAELTRTLDDHSIQIRDRDSALAKMQKHFKEELSDQKSKEMQQIERIATIEHDMDTLTREHHHLKDVLKQKGDDMEELKENLRRLQDDHSNQMSKVMNDSRVQRKSLKNLSSSVSSLKDLSYPDLGGQRTSQLQRKESIGSGLQNQDSSPLPTVREQLARSSMMGGTGTEDDDDLGIKQIILHYETMIQELAKSKNIDITLANEAITKLKTTLQEKQQEVLDLLSRFSPLMEFQMSRPSLEEERKNKIKEHYKADIDLLSVMLDKYQIQSLRKYK